MYLSQANVSLIMSHLSDLSVIHWLQEPKIGTVLYHHCQEPIKCHCTKQPLVPLQRVAACKRFDCIYSRYETHSLKGHSQLLDRADLDTTFASLSNVRVGYI